MPTVTARDLLSGDLAVQPSPNTTLLSVPRLRLRWSQLNPGFYQSSWVCFLFKKYFDFVWMGDMKLWQEIWTSRYFTYRAGRQKRFACSLWGRRGCVGAFPFPIEGVVWSFWERAVWTCQVPLLWKRAGGWVLCFREVVKLLVNEDRAAFSTENTCHLGISVVSWCFQFFTFSFVYVAGVFLFSGMAREDCNL